MGHFTHFRPFHQYSSYYPYYLPSHYSKYYSKNHPADNYPGRYHRFFEPTGYWLEKRKPLIQVEPGNAHTQRKLYKTFYFVLATALLFVIYKKTFLN